MSTISDKPVSHKLPVSAHPIAKQLYAEILSLAKERTVLMQNYMTEVAAVEAKFAPQSEELIQRINATKLKASQELCKALGLTYSGANGYSIDTSYLDDHGIAFLQVYERPDGLRFDGLTGDMPPAGTRLN